MKEILIAIGLQALYQVFSEQLIKQGVMLSRRAFIEGRMAVLLTPPMMLRLAALDPMISIAPPLLPPVPSIMRPVC